MIDENKKAVLKLAGYKPTYKGNPKQVKEAVTKIYDSKRPVIFAGGGIISSGGSDES